MQIPYTKAHGSKNDFLLTWSADVPAEADLAELAKAICDRHTGIGADGWLIVTPGEGDVAASIRLINSDGSDSEMSGNGTRCAAAFVLENGIAAAELVIRTGAGPKHLKVLGRTGGEWQFEMNMGIERHTEDEVHTSIRVGDQVANATILNVGNPQCAIFVADFDFDWRELGAAVERHERFPARTNVSFVRPLDRHAVEVRFWERGAGETMSSGTGSTGAAFAAVLRGLVESPVRVLTPAGPLDLRLAGNEMMLTGPAEIIATGMFFWRN